MMRLLIILLVSICHGYSPVAPAKSFDAKLMSVTVYAEHSGQGLFEEKISAKSVLNTGGLQVNMSPIEYLQMGAYLGVAEFDHNGEKEDKSRAFNSGYTFNFGLDAKILSPKFAQEKMRLIAGLSAGYLKPRNDDDFSENLLETHIELTLNYALISMLNIGLGAEFFLLQGDYHDFPFTGNEPFGNRDYFKGILSFEFYPKRKEDDKKTTFLNMTFKLGPDPGYDSDLGFQNVSIYLGLGVITPWKKDE